MKLLNFIIKDKYYPCLFALLFMMVCLVGAILNISVISTNGGRMPVLWEENYSSLEHFSYQNKNEVRQWFLSDIIDFGGFIFSIGDFLMIIGLLLSTITLMLRLRYSIKLRKKRNRH